MQVKSLIELMTVQRDNACTFTAADELMTSPSPDDFKLSADDRLFKNTPPPPTSDTTKPKRTALMVISFFLVCSLISQAWLWQQMNSDHHETLRKVNLLQSTLENSRTQVSTIDQQLNETFLQGSQQIKQLTDKIAQLENNQSHIKTQMEQNFAIKVDGVAANLKELQQIQNTQQQEATTFKTSINSLLATQTTLQTAQAAQQEFSSKIDALTQQLTELQKAFESQQKNLQTLQTSLQDLNLQVSTLADDANNAESTQSLDLYRQQVNQRLDQLTESVRQLKYPQNPAPL
jgi:DNA repair exonuclease SbcCD ATPase subunit